MEKANLTKPSTEFWKNLKKIFSETDNDEISLGFRKKNSA